MQQNKLLSYLARLDAEEMKRFARFMQSPYHTTNKPARALVEALAKCHPVFDSPQMGKEKLFQKIYGTKRPYHEGRLHQVMTQTVQLFKQFLAIDNMINSPLEMSKNGMAAMKGKKMDNAFFKEAQKREQWIETLAQGPDRYMEGYQLFKELFFHPATNRHLPEMTSIEKYVENLDWFILWEKQLTTNFLLNRQLVFPKKYDIELYEEITKTQSEKISQNFTLSLLNKLAKQQIEANEKEIINLLNEFLENFGKIEKQYSTIVYAFLKNLIALCMRSAPETFSTPIFKLIKLARANGLDLLDGKMSTNGMTAAVSVASKVGEFTFAENMLENHINLVPMEDQDDVLNLGWGYVNFWKGEKNNSNKYFNKAVDYLLKVNQNKPFFTYQVKALLLRSYYRLYLDDIAQQYFILDFSLAFERHLTRDISLSENKRKAYGNFCKLIRKLTKIKLEDIGKAEKKELLEKNINTEKILFAREWLLEKTKEL